jgi:hypothetical protein
MKRAAPLFQSIISAILVWNKGMMIMGTPEIALSISILALTVSIAVPMFLWNSDRRDKIDNKRTILLQRALDAKISFFEIKLKLDSFLVEHGSRINTENRDLLNSALPELDRWIDDLTKFHDQWSNYEDLTSITDIEKALSDCDAKLAQALVVEKRGVRMYELINKYLAAKENNKT